MTQPRFLRKEYSHSSPLISILTLSLLPNEWRVVKLQDDDKTDADEC